MKKVEHNEHLGIPTLRFVLVDVTHTGRFIQPATKHRVLHDHFLRDCFDLLLWEGYRRKTRKRGRPFSYDCTVSHESDKQTELHMLSLPQLVSCARHHVIRHRWHT